MRNGPNKSKVVQEPKQPTPPDSAVVAAPNQNPAGSTTTKGGVEGEAAEGGGESAGSGEWHKVTSRVQGEPFASPVSMRYTSYAHALSSPSQSRAIAVLNSFEVLATEGNNTDNGSSKQKGSVHDEPFDSPERNRRYKSAQ